MLILLEVQVLAKGSEIEGKIGNPQPFKPGQPSGAPPQTNGSAASNPPPAQNTAPASSNGGPLRRPPPSNPYNKGKLHFAQSVYTYKYTLWAATIHLPYDTYHTICLMI